MGLNVSKRVEHALTSSPEFDAACQSIYDRCLAVAQHAFPGVRRYQLFDAAAELHAALSAAIPFVHRWVPSPPDRSRVHDALSRVDPDHATEELTLPQFRAFAVELFREAVLDAAGRKVVQRVPVGIAGIAGVGMALHAGAGVVGRVMGVYTVGVVAAVYLSLS